MFRMVGARMGIGVPPLEIVQPRLQQAGLAAITLDEPWTLRQLVLGVRDNRALPPATRMLLDHLRIGEAWAQRRLLAFANHDGALPNRDLPPPRPTG